MAIKSVSAAAGLSSAAALLSARDNVAVPPFSHTHAQCPTLFAQATPARIASNFEAATRASPLLDEDDWQRLNALEDGHHYCWDPTWVA